MFTFNTLLVKNKSNGKQQLNAFNQQATKRQETLEANRMDKIIVIDCHKNSVMKIIIFIYILIVQMMKKTLMKIIMLMTMMKRT